MVQNLFEQQLETLCLVHKHLPKSCSTELFRASIVLLCATNQSHSVFEKKRTGLFTQHGKTLHHPSFHKSSLTARLRGKRQKQPWRNRTATRTWCKRDSKRCPVHWFNLCFTGWHPKTVELRCHSPKVLHYKIQIRNKCHASSNRCLTSSNKKLLNIVK